jgi:hypothetical protein
MRIVQPTAVVGRVESRADEATTRRYFSGIKVPRSWQGYKAPSDLSVLVFRHVLH